MEIRERVPPAFQLIWGTVRKNVEAMPDEGLDFTPAGLETRSFCAIAIHMANACVTFGENVGRSTWERITAFPPEKHTRKAAVLAALAHGGERFLAGVSRLSDDEAARVVRTPWGMEMPQGQIVAGHVPHMFYHNGQLAIYLRMQGVKPLFLAR
jgi:uncharacterized damage-inducible protein DinB